MMKPEIFGNFTLGIWFVLTYKRVHGMDVLSVHVKVGDPFSDNAVLDSTCFLSRAQSIAWGWKRVRELCDMTDAANEVVA